MRLVFGRSSIAKVCTVFLSGLGLPFAARVSGADLPYSENRVPPAQVRYQGTWRVTGVAAASQVSSIDKVSRHRLIGKELVISGSHADFGRIPFTTPVLDCESYDTHSREFLLDFRTPPNALSLPRYVGVANLELGAILDAGNGRYLLDYSGVWFTLEHASSNTQPSRNAQLSR